MTHRSTKTSINIPPLNIPPLATRLATGRPVLTKEQLITAAKRVLAASPSLPFITIAHSARVITRLANGRVLFSDDGDELTIDVWAWAGVTPVRFTTNQLDDAVLDSMVEKIRTLAQGMPPAGEAFMPSMPQTQDTYVPVQLWHDATVQAMSTARHVVIPDMLAAVAREGLIAAGFIGVLARAEVAVTNDGVVAFSEETDSEVTVTARGPDGRSSGWGGQATRNWATMNPMAVARHAITMAKLGANPVAFEPGRRTAILGPAAVVAILRFLAQQFKYDLTVKGMTAFSKHPHGMRLRERMFDERITMSSHPADPDGGYRPYFGPGLATPPRTWVDGGVLKELAYEAPDAMARGKPYSATPYSMRVSGGNTSIDEMIARCENGIYVNRLSSVDLLSLETGLVTGVTRDGCFLVRNGKIDRPVKNFRILESPFFFLNRIEALGPTARAPFGYTPPDPRNESPFDVTWPRPPFIAPSMMVKDFNFSAMADAV